VGERFVSARPSQYDAEHGQTDSSAAFSKSRDPPGGHSPGRAGKRHVATADAGRPGSVTAPPASGRPHQSLDGGGPESLNRISASISGTSAGVRLPRGTAPRRIRPTSPRWPPRDCWGRQNRREFRGGSPIFRFPTDGLRYPEFEGASTFPLACARRGTRFRRTSVRVLHFEPILRRSGAVGRRVPVRHNPFKPELAGVPKGRAPRARMCAR
jgi:hypothetical protein